MTDKGTRVLSENVIGIFFGFHFCVVFVISVIKCFAVLSFLRLNCSFFNSTFHMGHALWEFD